MRVGLLCGPNRAHLAVSACAAAPARAQPAVAGRGRRAHIAIGAWSHPTEDLPIRAQHDADVARGRHRHHLVPLQRVDVLPHRIGGPTAAVLAGMGAPLVKVAQPRGYHCHGDVVLPLRGRYGALHDTGGRGAGPTQTQRRRQCVRRRRQRRAWRCNRRGRRGRRGSCRSGHSCHIGRRSEQPARRPRGRCESRRGDRRASGRRRQRRCWRGGWRQLGQPRGQWLGGEEIPRSGAHRFFLLEAALHEQHHVLRVPGTAQALSKRHSASCTQQAALSRRRASNKRGDTALISGAILASAHEQTALAHRQAGTRGMLGTRAYLRCARRQRLRLTPCDPHSQLGNILAKERPRESDQLIEDDAERPDLRRRASHRGHPCTCT